MRFKSRFESRERESQFNRAGGSEFQVRGAAVLNDRLANDVCRNGTHSSGTETENSFFDDVIPTIPSMTKELERVRKLL